MSARTLVTILLWVSLACGVLAMPAAIVISVEDGPMPADQVFRKMWLARTVLLAGGGATALAACGLYAIGSPTRPHD